MIRLLDQRRTQSRQRAINIAFVRTQDTKSVADRFVYFFGTLIAEDFMEIFLVSVHGYGAAAMKLLRTMHEQTVTLRYLHDHPDEAQTLLDFNAVQLQKLTKPIDETLGTHVLSDKLREEQKKRFEVVKEQFMVKSCRSKICTEMRLGHTRGKLEFVSMAKKAGHIGTLIVPGYFVPLRHAHPTLGSLCERIEIVGDHKEFKSEHQPDLADQALMTAENCLLTARGSGRAIQHRETEGGYRRVRDWRDIWSPGSVIPGEKD